MARGYRLHPHQVHEFGVLGTIDEERKAESDRERMRGGARWPFPQQSF